MELIGSLLLILALALLVALFLARPFIQKTPSLVGEANTRELEKDHRRSSLLAERDRLLNALQELDFDYGLGKVPAEDYPVQRAALLKHGADVLRELDALQPEILPAGQGTAEDRIEEAIASRRADGGTGPAAAGQAGNDSLEDLIAQRKRQRQEKTVGFCPKCGKPAQKSDQFCSRCGASL